MGVPQADQSQNLSPLDIFNMAIQQMGQSPVSDFDVNVGGSFFTKKFYDQERRALLRRINWNFARRFASLATMPQVPLALALNADADAVGAIQYTAAYRLPIDFIRFLKFSPYTTHYRILGNKTLITDAVPPLATGALLGLQPIGSDGSDNQPPAAGTTSGGYPVGIEYIYDEQSPDKWDSMFTECLVHRFVYIMAFGITGLASIRQDAKEEYRMTIADAAYINGAEQQPETYNDNIVQDVRFGYVGTDLDTM
jgi:hypothetical protein